MILKPRQAVASLTAFALTASLLVTGALAAPPKTKKPPTKKPPVKKDTKKDDAKALVAAGKKIYDNNGCANCHAIAGKGGMAAPELTKVAANAKHNAKWLEESIVNPKADVPDSTMPSYEETIKGKDLKALVAYLGSLK